MFILRCGPQLFLQLSNIGFQYPGKHFKKEVIMERSKSKIEHNIISINNKKTNLNRIDDECVSQRWIPTYFEIM